MRLRESSGAGRGSFYKKYTICVQFNNTPRFKDVHDLKLKFTMCGPFHAIE